jgi:hypothetical protein
MSNFPMDALPYSRGVNDTTKVNGAEPSGGSMPSVGVTMNSGGVSGENVAWVPQKNGEHCSTR